MTFRSLSRRALLWMPPIVYAALIFHFSSESNPLPALTALVWDKALHATEYAGLAFLVCRALRGEGLRPWVSVALAILIASAYGGSDEWHQFFVPGRDSDVMDWVGDTFGSTLGAPAYTAIIWIAAGGARDAVRTARSGTTAR
jgi:VanZ family protein